MIARFSIGRRNTSESNRCSSDECPDSLQRLRPGGPATSGSLAPTVRFHPGRHPRGHGAQHAAGARAGSGSLGDPEAIGARADRRARSRRTPSRPVMRRVHLAGPPATPSPPKRRGRGESSSSGSIAGRPRPSLDWELSDARRKEAAGRARHGRPHPHSGKPPGLWATVSSLVVYQGSGVNAHVPPPKFEIARSRLCRPMNGYHWRALR